MSRVVLGDCLSVLPTLPDRCVDLVLTDPPYLVNYVDRSGRSIANDRTDEWMTPAFAQMFRVFRGLARGGLSRCWAYRVRQAVPIQCPILGVPARVCLLAGQGPAGVAGAAIARCAALEVHREPPPSDPEAG
ncbi:hypothetical protein G6F65_021741 [Rhizopus arrhizus]|nr:hypothetical protein G6F65_021741 [Rhizopus arrhizus]